MKKIILVRHAKVDIDNTNKIDAISLKKWVEEYDIAPIDIKSLPMKNTILLANKADIVITSTLSRAMDSAKVLNVEIYEQNKLFNEATIPDVNIPFLKLKPKTWLVMLRVMLLFGLGKKETSLKASKERAKKATNRLLALSTQYDHVVLVGHGGINWLIYKELINHGWKLEGKPSHKNWGSTTLTYVDTLSQDAIL